MKKLSFLFLSIIIAISLSSCMKADTPTIDTTVDFHEEIIVLDNSAELDNPFYARATDEAGNPAFMVKRQRDGEDMLLPISNTVLYVTKEASNYYEKNTITVIRDGNTETVEQYALYVQDTETADPVSSHESISQ